MEGPKGSVRITITILCFIVLMHLSDLGKGVEAMTAGECKQERKVLVNACKSLVARRGPSSYCCQRLRAAHVECVCPVITPKLAALIDVNYAVRVVQSCGRQVPRHFKCGSITTP
ncbi:hypothetical protein ACET3Z_003280 [Daucus carota]